MYGNINTYQHHIYSVTFKTVSLTYGHAGGEAVRVEDDVGLHPTLCEGHVLHWPLLTAAHTHIHEYIIIIIIQFLYSANSRMADRCAAQEKY